MVAPMVHVTRPRRGAARARPPPLYLRLYPPGI